MDKRRIKVCLILLTLVIQWVGLFSMPIMAAKEKEVIKVACYPLDGFFEYNNFGKVSGYGVDVLDRMSMYMGVEFQYVRAKNWAETKEMVLDGRADIRMPITLPDNFNKVDSELAVSSVGIMETYHVLMTTNDREDLKYEDKDKFKNIKVGVCSSLYNSQDFSDALRKLEISEDQLHFYSEYEECNAALKSGKIDAVVTNVMDYTSENKLLGRFKYTSNYIMAKKGSNIIERIDDALSQIKVAEPTFLSKLYSEYYPERVSVPLTPEESAYIKGINKLTFAFVDKCGYLCKSDKNGKLTGIYPEIAREICRRLGVECEEVVIDPAILDQCIKDESVEGLFDMKEMQGIDVWIDMFFDATFINSLNVYASNYLIKNDYYAVSRKGEEIDFQEDRVAVVDNIKESTSVINILENNNVVRCKSYEDSLEKIRKNEADFAIMNNMVAEYYMPYYKNSNLSVSMVEVDCSSCMATNVNVLSSILGKEMQDISTEKLSQIVYYQTKDTPEQNSFIGKIYNNPEQSLKIVVTMVLVSFIIVALLIAVYREERQNEFLKNADRSRKEFMSRMSHDIRTPMNAVLGMTHLAKETQDPVLIGEYLDKIDGAGKYLLTLLNDMLDMTKVENGAINLKEEPKNVKGMIDNIVDIFSDSAKDKDVDIILDINKAADCWILTDEMRTKQIYSNLLSNAIKFTPPGGKISWSTMGVMLPNNQIKITTTIKDDGCGMSEEFQKRMFIPFEREENSYSKESMGTGLGLAITKSLVEHMGGTISVTSSLGHGTTFTLCFIRNLADGKQESKKNEKTSEKVELEGKRILIVEDQQLNREILQRLLDSRKMIVEVAEDGEKAVEAFKNSEAQPFDLILMDIRMPRMDGIEATKTIRSLSLANSKTIPIIALTANSFDEDRMATKMAGMNEHLAKPINPKELFGAIETHLQ